MIIYFLVYIDTDNWDMKVTKTGQAKFFGQIYLLQSHRQKAFCASKETWKHWKVSILSDTPHWLIVIIILKSEW